VREALVSSSALVVNETIGTVTASITTQVLVKAAVAKTIAPITLSTQAQVIVKAVVAETIAAPTSTITDTVTGSGVTEPASVFGGALPSWAFFGRSRRRRPITARLEKFIPPIDCQASARAFYGANVAAEFGSITLHASGKVRLSDAELLVVLVASGILQ
jgi:hypothetical protein